MPEVRSTASHDSEKHLTYPERGAQGAVKMMAPARSAAPVPSRVWLAGVVFCPAEAMQNAGTDGAFMRKMEALSLASSDSAREGVTVAFWLWEAG